MSTTRFSGLRNVLTSLLNCQPARRRQAGQTGSKQNTEALETRELMSVSQLWFNGSTLVVKTDNNSTDVMVSTSASNVVVRDNSTSRQWSYASTTVGQVEFQGGNGNDKFVNNIATLKIRAFGGAGNDYLEGYNGADYFDGGAGNDTIKGYGGDDILFGGDGNDVLLGMNGNDQLAGGNGNDQLNGQAGNDKLWGEGGDDVLIAIDSATGDYVDGGAGRDALWVDKNSAVLDRVYGLESIDKLQQVASFANGADRTLDGDRLADPAAKSGQTYKTFAGNPLFSSAGPQMNDIRQGYLGDCYYLAALSGIAMDNPTLLRQYIVDFNDGTYGVRLGNSFYRVDNDLPVNSSSSTTPAYAQLGAQNSMWVAIAEKAWAFYRTSARTYASIEGGWSVEANRAFGSTSAGERDLQSYGNATNLVNDILNKWLNHQAVTIGFLGVKNGGTGPAALFTGHMYTVASVIRNTAGAVTAVVLRNPWGYDGKGSDGNPNDGLITVTPTQLIAYTGRVNWGAV